MHFGFALIAATLLAACSPLPEAGSPEAGAAAARDAAGFPAADRPVAGIVASEWSSGPDRDAADESGQLIRGLDIRPGMAVADIGAGEGYYTIRLASRVGKDGRVVAEDIVPEVRDALAQRVVRDRLDNVSVKLGDPANPKLPDNSFDRIVMVHMYHEVESPYALLWNLATSLKPGAQVGVIDLDRPIDRHGTPPALLKCEFEAVGYRHVRTAPMTGGVGYLAVFEAPTQRPKPTDIQPCEAP